MKPGVSGGGTKKQKTCEFGLYLERCHGGPEMTATCTSLTLSPQHWLLALEPEAAGLSSHFPSRHSLMVALQLLWAQEAAAPGTLLGLMSSPLLRLRLLHSQASVTGSLEQVTWQSYSLLIGLLQHGDKALVVQDIGLGDKPLDSRVVPITSLRA